MAAYLPGPLSGRHQSKHELARLGFELLVLFPYLVSSFKLI